MQKQPLLHTFSTDLAELKAIQSNQSRNLRLRHDIEARERDVVRLLFFDDRHQEARRALRRQGNNATVEAKAAVRQAAHQMSESGATRLKNAIIDLNRDMVKLFNEVHFLLQEKLERGQLRLGVHSSPVPPLGPQHTQVSRTIPRVHHRNLSFADFLHRFAIPKKPVIITGLNFTGDMNPNTGHDWTLDYFRRVCGDRCVSAWSAACCVVCVLCQGL